MAQVLSHDVDGKGDHYLTLDDGRQVVVPYSLDLVGAGWGRVLAAAGGSATAGAPEPKPKGKTRSG